MDRLSIGEHKETRSKKIGGQFPERGKPGKGSSGSQGSYWAVELLMMNSPCEIVVDKVEFGQVSLRVL